MWVPVCLRVQSGRSLTLFSCPLMSPRCNHLPECYLVALSPWYPSLDAAPDEISFQCAGSFPSSACSFVSSAAIAAAAAVLIPPSVRSVLTDACACPASSPRSSPPCLATYRFHELNHDPLPAHFVVRRLLASRSRWDPGGCIQTPRCLRAAARLSVLIGSAVIFGLNFSQT